MASNDSNACATPATPPPPPPPPAEVAEQGAPFSSQEIIWISRLCEIVSEFLDRLIFAMSDLYVGDLNLANAMQETAIRDDLERIFDGMNACLQLARSPENTTQKAFWAAERLRAREYIGNAIPWIREMNNRLLEFVLLGHEALVKRNAGEPLALERELLDAVNQLPSLVDFPELDVEHHVFWMELTWPTLTPLPLPLYREPVRHSLDRMRGWAAVDMCQTHVKRAAGDPDEGAERLLRASRSFPRFSAAEWFHFGRATGGTDAPLEEGAAKARIAREVRRRRHAQYGEFAP
ncbi:hypothetical protein F4780DRAFT_798721 [Xylariomycetidae sp. FL0641]|nr:hypothetical protein F4780DRAFT_798721 [Xylariomycetidae sp. FL0641]